MTVEEILAALQAIIDEATAAGGPDAPLTDEQASRYEALEQQLAVARRSQEIRARQTAYTTPVRGDLHVNVGNNRERGDTLERAFEAYLRTGQKNSDITELRAQSTSNTEGGYTVPPGFRQKLVEVQAAFGGFAAEADSLTTTSGETLRFPSNDDTANSGAIAAEGSQFQGGADLVFGNVQLDSYKYTSTGTGNNPLKISVELLADSAFDINGYVSRKLGERIYRKMAADFVTGSGSSQPDGILRSGLTEDETADAPPTIDYDDLLDLEGALDPAYEPNAKWLMSKATWVQIRGLLDGGSTGRPIIYDQAASGMRTQPEKLLMGYTVVLDQASPAASGGAGRNCIAFGDFREAYVIRYVSDVAVIVNPYTSANTGQVEYVAWARADGTVQNRSAYKILKA